MKRILITGAAGHIGRTLRQGLHNKYPVLRLSDIAPLGPAQAGEEIANADLTDLASVEAAMQDKAVVERFLTAGSQVSYIDGPDFAQDRKSTRLNSSH